MRTTILACVLLCGCGAPTTGNDGPIGNDDSGAPPDLAPAGCSPACSGLTPLCNATRHCVGCLADGDCAKGSYCKIVSDAIASCQIGCDTDDSCTAPQKCCASRCVDLQTDLQHCGGCATTCTPAHSSATCAAGKCTPGACDPGWGDCNADPADGCEASLSSDVKNCTGCGKACAIPNAIAGCANGCYAAACMYGFEDCNMNLMDGCETSLLADIKNCGGCAKACPVAANASIACQNGGCVLAACNAGFADCDNNLATGCETPIANDIKNCGGCGKVCGQNQVCTLGICTCPACNLPNANSGCVNFNCAILSCLQGWADCDGNTPNGCEQNVATDVNHCGGCNNICPNGLACVNGGCTCPQCNIPHAKTICVNNMCVLDSCLPGFANCDGNPANGCEADLNGDAANCNGCGMACPNGQACSGGQCTTCGNQIIDSASLLCVPQGQTYTLGGDKCYTSQVIVNGTLVVQQGVALVLRSPAITVGVTGKINGDVAGQPGGLPSNNSLGGLQGAGVGAGCGGGPGNSVGQGGSGGGYGGDGAHAKQFSNVGQCEKCNNPTLAHCWGAGGPANGTQGGADVDLGSGGGAGGNSAGCNNSGGRGGRGGGSVLLLGKTVTLNGAISASGEQPPKDVSCGYHPGGGGGSGGSVVVRADQLSGAGTLTAAGGKGGDTDGMNADWGWSGGGGGGGRVKVFAAADAFNGMLAVPAGVGGATCGGGQCTVGLTGTVGTTSRTMVIPNQWQTLNCGGF